MFILTVFRLTKLGVVNFWRNLWLSLIATFVMSLTLMTITVLSLSAFLVNGEIDNIKSRIDYEIYFNDNVAEEEITQLSNSIKNLVEVNEVKFISKEEAVEKYKEIYGDKDSLTKYIEQENPLKSSMIVKTVNPEDLSRVDELVNGEKYKNLVYSSSYSQNREVIERLIGIIDFVEKAGVAIGLVFVIIAVTVIFSIVRVAIYSRKDEIEIMKLVGATDWFVHAPFIIESALYGIIAAFLSLGFIAGIYYYVSSVATTYLSFSVDHIQAYLSEYFVFVVLFQVLMGLIISISAAFFAIRKHV